MPMDFGLEAGGEFAGRWNAASVVAGSITHAATAMPRSPPAERAGGLVLADDARGRDVTMSAMTRSRRMSHGRVRAELPKHRRRRVPLDKQQVHAHRAVGDGERQHGANSV